MQSERPAVVAVGPELTPELREVVTAAGAEACSPTELDRADALLWTDSRPDSFPDELPPGIRWVQLPSAGIEAWLAAGLLDDSRAWSTAAGAYAPQVAEHALALLLGGLRQLPAAVRAHTWAKAELVGAGRSLRGATVGIYGAGGIAHALVPSLRALGADAVAVNRSGRAVPGAVATLAADRATRVWAEVDHMVLCAPATAATKHLVGESQLTDLGEAGWLVNVARGSLVDQDALRAALDAGRIAGAALDVTDPEPLPDGHWMFDHERVLLTPHVANPQPCLDASLRERMAENLRRWIAGDELLGAVDLARGY